MKRLMSFSLASLTCLLVMTFVLAACTGNSVAGLSNLHEPLAQLTASPSPSASAEYAIRWNVNEGGPKTAVDTLTVLGQTQTDSDNYEVQYFDFTSPAGVPTGVTTILRQRKKKKKFDLTFKYRSESPLAKLGCPISDNPSEIKDEVDVTILGATDSKRVNSHSCTVESADVPVSIPPALAAKPAPCTSTMTRLKAGTLKIEEWHLPGGAIMVEVSRNGTTSASDLASFQHDVVNKLIAAGVKPSGASKTELGSSCQ